MSTFKTSVDWEVLERDCKEVHSCSTYQLQSATRRKDRREQRRIEKQRQQIENVHEAARQALTANPNQTEEQLTGSIIAILLPWVLPILRDWLLGAFERLILNWLLNRLKTSSS